MNHLHIRSCYSLLESDFRIEDIVKTSIELGFRHACLTDHNSMYATMHFWHACKKAGIHPIFGLEVEVTYHEHHLNLILYAKNDEGLQNLYHISSLKMCQEDPIDIYQLASMSPSCLVLTGGGQDTIDTWMMHDAFDSIQSTLKEIAPLWSDFFVSIAMNDSKFRQVKNQQLRSLAHTLGLRTVALSRIYYKRKQDAENLRVLRAIAAQSDIQDQTLDVQYNRYMRTQEEMEALYDEEDLQMTDTITNMCNVQMAMPKSQLPSFSNKLQIDNTQYLIKLCKKGLMKRCNNQVSEAYIKRLEYELSIITKMGFTNYFLIVWDFIREARQRDIYVGPGRGSAAGSLTAYCLGITHIDPIKNHLLFERFLNPERVSMPDIDTDFPDDRRDEVIEYVANKYGKQHVAHIATFNTMKARQVLRDVARVSGYPMYKIDALTKWIPDKPKDTLAQAYRVPAFRKLVESDAETKQLFQRCLPLEGLPRHVSKHAAGIVLSNQDLETVCPVVQVDQDLVATQFTMEYLEELGLIKMDFLGIRNLKTIHSIVKQIDDQLSILNIPLNDAKTFQLLTQGDTLGVFQLESEGIKNVLMKVQPKRFEDICAVLALYRPAAMQHIDEYIENRKHPESIEYIDFRLEPILKETYGVMLYQEQAMQIAQLMANFSLAQADNLRKAMGKKNMEAMKSYHDQFVSGAIRNGFSTKKSEEVFSLLEKFAEYGFNKSHSYAYGLISYQMAYLKVNYPLYFYQYLLDSVIGSEIKTSQYIYECQKRHIQVLLPNVNTSQATYSVQNRSIQMPLCVLKSIGMSVYKEIDAERKQAEFADYIDFVVRMSSHKISEAQIHALIDGGALDSFGLTRETMNENLPIVQSYADIIKTETNEGVLFNYDVVSRPSLMQMKDHPLTKAQKEKQVFGFYMSEHPVSLLRKKYTRAIPISDCEQRNGYLQVLGRVTRFKVHQTKNQSNMCFMTIEDESGKIDIAVMPRLYEANKEAIQKDRIVVIQGKKDRPQSILANQMTWIQTNES